MSDADESTRPVLEWEKKPNGQPKNELGRGRQGAVFRGIFYGLNPKGEPVAIKEVIMAKPETQREWETLRQLQHENIVRYYGFVPASNAAVMRIVLELCQTSLQVLMDNSTLQMSQFERREHCKQLVNGLVYLHGKGVAHRDLNPANILLQGMPAGRVPVLKIADFGMAKTLDHSQYTGQQSVAGTQGFQPLEVLDANTNVQPKTSDCFSMGIVLHMLLSEDHKHPFDVASSQDDGCSQNEVAVRIKNIRADKKMLDPSIARTGLALITAVLEQNPAQRPADARRCRLEYEPFFEVGAPNFSKLLTEVTETLGHGFAKTKNTEPTQLMHKRRELAKTLHDYFVPYLKADLGHTNWVEKVKEPANGSWDHDPDKIYQRFTNNDKKGDESIPGFGLLKWLRNFYSHIGQYINHGQFDTLPDAYLYINERFPWVCAALHQFAREHLRELMPSNDPDSGRRLDADGLSHEPLPPKIKAQRRALELLSQVKWKFVSLNASPLHLAAQEGSLQAIRLLLESKADVHAQTSNGQTPTYTAAAHDRPAALRLLLDAKADINQPDSSGFTPAWASCAYGNPDVLRVLIEAKADTNVPANNGMSPLQAARTIAMGTNPECIALLEPSSERKGFAVALAILGSVVVAVLAVRLGFQNMKE